MSFSDTHGALSTLSPSLAAYSLPPPYTTPSLITDSPSLPPAAVPSQSPSLSLPQSKLSAKKSTKPRLQPWKAVKKEATMIDDSGSDHDRHSDSDSHASHSQSSTDSNDENHRDRGVTGKQRKHGALKNGAPKKGKIVARGVRRMSPPQTSVNTGQGGDRGKWSDAQMEHLNSGVVRHGTDFKAMLDDPELKPFFKGRSAASLHKAYHRFHPQGQKVKVKLVKKATSQTSNNNANNPSNPNKANANNASNDHHSDSGTSSDDEGSSSSGSESGSESGSGSGSGSDSSSGSGSSSSSDNESEDEQISNRQQEPPTNPQLSHPHNHPQHIRNMKPRIGPGGVLEDSRVAIEPWEKPANDKRDDSFFCRCRHICGCRSTSAEGRPWANGQAVMVRGSRRNHETNQKLHPDCVRGGACWALLHSLKDARQSKTALQQRPRKNSLGETNEGEHDLNDIDDERGLKKRKHHETNGKHSDDMYDDMHSLDHRALGDDTVPVSHSLFQAMLEQCQVLNMEIRSVHAQNPLLGGDVGDLATAMVHANARITEQQAHIESLQAQVTALNEHLANAQQQLVAAQQVHHAHHQHPHAHGHQQAASSPPLAMNAPSLPHAALPPPPPSLKELMEKPHAHPHPPHPSTSSPSQPPQVHHPAHLHGHHPPHPHSHHLPPPPPSHPPHLPPPSHPGQLPPPPMPPGMNAPPPPSLEELMAAAKH